MSNSLDSEVRRKFAARLNSVLGAHTELLLAIHNKKNEASLASMLVEQFALLVCVMWEAFINDLLIAYVTLDSSVYLESLKARMGQSVKERFGSEACRALRIEFPRKLSARQAAALLDPKKWNVTFDSAETLANRANSLLAAVYAKKFSFDAGDSEFINLCIGLRNYLSHRSRGSSEILKRGIAHLAAATNKDLHAPLLDVASYLKTKDSSGESRVVKIAVRFKGIAARL